VDLLNNTAALNYQAEVELSHKSTHITLDQDIEEKWIVTRNVPLDRKKKAPRIQSKKKKKKKKKKFMKNKIK
jgi:hypothetical protein